MHGFQHYMMEMNAKMSHVVYILEDYYYTMQVKSQALP